MYEEGNYHALRGQDERELATLVVSGFAQDETGRRSKTVNLQATHSLRVQNRDLHVRGVIPLFPHLGLCIGTLISFQNRRLTCHPEEPPDLFVRLFPSNVWTSSLA